MHNTVLYFNEFISSDGDYTLSSVDNYSLTNYDGSPREHTGESVTNIAAGSWFHFRSAIPQGNYACCMLFTSTQTSDQLVEIRLGDINNAPTWSFKMTTTAVGNYFTDTISPVIHYDSDAEQDIYICFPHGFTGAINWFVMCQNSQTETNEAKLNRMKWFTDSRFGHMMHWGAYSVLGRGEWVMDIENIPKDQYIQEACIPFDPKNYDPEYWAQVIASTGQKYLTITTKHHDGFAMFDTNIVEFAPYDVVNTANVHLSVLRPLAEACRAHGITFCAYYSLVDWANVNEVAIESDTDNVNPDDVARYLSELKEHLREVIEIFDPALYWFDGSWASFLTGNTPSQLRWYIRRLSPNIIINDRLGGSPNVGDYLTSEQSIPAGSQNSLWESCMTMNDNWGYTINDNNWKSTTTLLANLLDCASKGGNLLLNTGPDGDGVIPAPCIDRLKEIGTWMDQWGEAVYQSRAGTLDVSAQKNAYCTVGADNKVYITLMEWPANGKVSIDAPTGEIGNIYLLNAPDVALSWHYASGLIVIDIPAVAPDSLASVVVMEMNELPQAKTYRDKALFRTATASSIWGDSYGPQFVLDGNNSTRWASGDGSHPVTLEIDLCQNETMNRVAFLQFQQRINAFTIEARIDGNWQTVLEGTVPAQNYIGYLDTTITADALRLTINSCIKSTDPASLYSFSVIDTNDDLLPVNLPVNIARGAQAQASDVWFDNPTYQPGMAIDGLGGPNSTRWATNTNPILPLYFTLNFIKEETFDIVRIDEYNGGITNIADFTLQILSEVGEWVDVYHGTDVSKPLILAPLTKSNALRLRIDQTTSATGPSLYEVAVYQTAREALPELTDDRLLEAEARLSFEYLWREANTTDGSKGYGLVTDTMGSRRASIACSGFALSALPIAVERRWLSREIAEDRALKSLQALYNTVPQYKGFFYHFMDMDTLDTQGSEVSTVDTMLAVNGVLVAGQYFGGECADLAQQIFDRVEWSSAIAPNGQFTMAWQDGVMSTSTWGGYAEQFCLYPLAAGSTTYAPADTAAMFYSLERKYGHYADSGDLIYVWGGQLFTYQFSHTWLDFRKVEDRNGADWWQNSVNANRANRQFCIDNSNVMPSLGENDWGLTACDSPSGYNAFGAPPSGDIGSDNMHYTDGTVTPSGPLGSLPFMPTEVLAAAQHWYQNPRLWTGYGFLEAYNTSMALPWYSSTASGLTKGLTLLMIENYRSGLVWSLWNKHPVIQRGLPVIFDIQEAETIYTESDLAISYTGNWFPSTGRPQSSDHTSMAAFDDGSFFEFTFEGTNVAYYGEKNSDQGDIDFYIDNVFQGTANTYATQDTYSDIIFAVTGLPSGTHTFKGIKSGATWMTLDYLKTSQDGGLSVELTDIVLTQYQGMVQLTFTQSLDRASATDPENYQFNPEMTVTQATLSQDKKQVTLTLSGGSDKMEGWLTLGNIENDILTNSLQGHQIRIETTMLPPEQLYNNTDPAITYLPTNSWTFQKDRDASIFYGNSTVTADGNGTFSLTFEGTGIAYYTETNSDQGDVEIYIDGISQGIISTRTSERMDSHIVYQNTTLPLGKHVIEGAKRSGQWMLVDALKVYNEGDITLSSTLTDGSNNIIITFNQALDANDAVNLQNYALDGGAVIVGATLNRQQNSVTLATQNLQYQQSYNLTIQNIRNQIHTATLVNTVDTFVNWHGMVHWYQFNDLDQGIVTDTITGDQSAAINGDINVVEGKSGTACAFSGNAWLDLGKIDVFQGEAFAAEAWIKPLGGSGKNYCTILSQEFVNVDADRVWFNYYNNQVQFILADDTGKDSGSLTSHSFVAEDAWTHVAITRNDDGEMMLAINGNVIMTDRFKTIQLNDRPLFIGARQQSESGGMQHFFNGVIDELRLYATGVTADEITAHYRELADENFNLTVSNGVITVAYVKPQATAPTLEDFRFWIKNTDEIRIGLAIDDFVWDNATQTATMAFTPLPAGDIEQNVTITAQYLTLPVKASFSVAATHIPAPEVTSLQLTGELLTREILTADWQLSDPAGLSENGSTYEWWMGSSLTGEFTLIEGVHTRSLMLLEAYVGQYIKVGVTPRNSLFASGSTAYATTSAPIVHQAGNPRTDWLMEAKYGISSHFLSNYQGISSTIPPEQQWQPGEDWDDFLSTFDVDTYVNTVVSLKVGFVLITIDQHAGYNLAPSTLYDNILGIPAGVRSPSKRDILMEIAVALKPHGIHLMCYFMGFMPSYASLVYYDDNPNSSSLNQLGDLLATRTFEVAPFDGVYTRESTRMHAAVMRSFGEHYGEYLMGFWFDGMYDGSWFQDMPAQYNIHDLIDGARAANPQRIVTGAGMGGTEYMDYSHGESYGSKDMDDEHQRLVMTEAAPTSRWDSNDGYHQWFRWTPLGDSSLNAGWGAPTTQEDGRYFNTDKLAEWVKEMTNPGGTVCLDVRLNRFGELDEFAVTQVAAVRDAVYPPADPDEKGQP